MGRSARHDRELEPAGGPCPGEGAKPVGPTGRGAGGAFGQARPRRRSGLHPSVVAVVFAGGCLGGAARYAVTRVWPTAAGGFPWPILVVNTSGAFALALLLVLASEVMPPTTHLRPALGTGFLGAWTTFSAVAVEVDRAVAQGRPSIALLYLLGSVLGGLAAAAFGLVVGRSVAAWRHRGRETDPAHVSRRAAWPSARLSRKGTT